MLKIERIVRADWTVIKLSGALTEQGGVQLLHLYSETAPKCVFNLRDIVSINSLGVRAWIMFLREFRVDREVEIDECPSIIVDQMNMLSNFTQKAAVRSVFVPMTCGGCNARTDVLLNKREFPKAGETVRPLRCKACGGSSTLDDDAYFDFLEHSA